MALYNRAAADRVTRLLFGGQSQMVTSTYSTGGGGTTLERRFAVRYLTYMLVGKPLPEHDGYLVTRVQFQKVPEPVDDVVVTLSPLVAGLPQKELRVASRRRPQFIKSSSDTEKLVASLLEALELPLGDTGERRLVVAASLEETSVSEFAGLAGLAGSRQESDFLEYIDSNLNAPLSKRLDHVKALVRGGLAANGALDPSPESVTKAMIRLLRASEVLTLRLEPPNETDWDYLLDTLRDWAFEGNAGGLRDRLQALADTWGPAGAVIDPTTLGRELAGCIDSSQRRNAQAWSLLRELDLQARRSVGHTIGSGTNAVTLQRSEVVEQLRSSLSNHEVLIVTGQSGVGKSSSVMSALDAAVQEETGEPSDRIQSLALHLAHLSDRPADLLGQLQCPLGDLLSELTKPTRVLVIDGADHVLESGSDVLGALSVAAADSGVRLCVVCSDNALDAVREHVEKATGSTAKVERIPLLSDDDLRVLAESFPKFSQVLAISRATAVVRRPVVADLLARSGDESVPLCEMDVYDTFWESLVRQGGGAGTAFARETVLLRLAVAQADSTADAQLDPTGVESLIASGILRPAPRIGALQPTFAHDIYRTYATTRMILAEEGKPHDLLVRMGAPRWMLPASIIAAQVLIDASRQNSAEGLDLIGLNSSFDAVAAAGYGERWREVPYEAMLEMPFAEEILRKEWQRLRTGNSAGFRRLLEVAARRFGSLPFRASLLRPLVRLLTADGEVNTADPDVLAVLEAWLVRLLLTQVPAGDTDRVALLRSLPAALDPDTRGLVALLGPDIGSETEAALLTLAVQQPGELQPLVDSVPHAYGLYQRKPELLGRLAEAYYIDESHHSLDFEQGVRSHLFRTPLEPMFGYEKGPFLGWLRWARNDDTLHLAVRSINKILNHAATVSVESYGNDSSKSLEVIVNGNARSFVGSDVSWLWYRGTGVGPYPCVSALQALELVMDESIADGKPIGPLMTQLLDGAESLAVAGLVVGLGLRYCDEAPELLDPFLTHPKVWELEQNRQVNEHTHLRLSSEVPVLHPERRRLTLPYFVLAQVAAAGGGRTRELRELGLKLAANGADDPYVLRLSEWFDGENYVYRDSESGSFVSLRSEYIHEPPSSEQEAEMVLARNFPVGNEYRSPDQVSVETDLALCQLDRDESERARQLWAEARPVVAAAALRALSQGQVSLPEGDLEWCVSVLGEANVEGRDRADLEIWSTSPSLVSGLALLLDSSLFPSLVPKLAEMRDSIRSKLHSILRRAEPDAWLAFFHVAADGFHRPCSSDPCHHGTTSELISFSIARIEASAQERFDAACSRGIDQYTYQNGAGSWINHELLAGPLLAAAAGLDCRCLGSQPSEEQIDYVFSLYIRCFAGGVGSRSIHGRDFPLLGRALFDLAASDRVSQVTRLIADLGSDVQHRTLEAIRQVAGDDSSKRPALASFWPDLARQLLPQVGHEVGYIDPLAALIPTVIVDKFATDQNDRYMEATANWLPVAAVEPFLEAWGDKAIGRALCATALGGYCLTVSLDWTVEVGLPLIRRCLKPCEDEHLYRGHVAWLRDLIDDPENRRILSSSQDAHWIADRYGSIGNNHGLAIQTALEIPGV